MSSHSTVPIHRPSDPRMMPSVLSSRARRGQKTSSASCPREAARCRHVSHAARIATPFGCCKPANLSAVSACRRFSGPRSPPAALVQTPRAFQVVCRFTEGHFRVALPKDRPRCHLCSGPGIRYAGYPDRFSSHHSAAETRILLHRPRSGLLPQSRRRDLSAEDLCAKAERPRSSPSEEPWEECSRILPPDAPNAALSSTPTAQHLSACPFRSPRPVGPQKEGTQPEAGCLSSQAPGAILLVAACISVGGRMSSASIGPPGSWPHLPSTLRLSRPPQPASRRDCPIPPPAAPRGILRSRPAAPPQSTPAKRRAIFNNNQSINYQTTRLFDPTLHFGSTSKVCATRTFVLNSPLWALWSPQGDRPGAFAAARGSRA